MKLQRHFSLKFALLMPLIVSLVLVGLVVKSHNDVVNRAISVEYERLKDSFLRATKVIAALDYSFTNYYKSGGVLLLKHNKKIENGICQVWPIDTLLTGEGKSIEISAVNINYMLVGEESICDPDNEFYQRASNQVSLAPVLSFLHDLDKYLLGIHYFDKEGYAFSSPDTMARNISAEFLATMKSRPYWYTTANHQDKITISGPTNSVILMKEVMSMTVPVNAEGEFQGMISLDIDMGVLLKSNDKFSGDIRILNIDNDIVPPNAMRVNKLNFEGVLFNHVIYYDFDLQKEIQFFFQYEKFSLLIILLIYIFSVLALFYVNSNVERSHFRELAAKDPMTGILNRRGFEAYLASVSHEHLFGLAIFDIDDFKMVNDTYGHDVGDDVICYMAKQIEKNIRGNDAVARFGGEEFVIYLEGQSEIRVRNTLQRVVQAICSESKQVVETGFTVSGGVEIVKPSFNIDFDQIIKSADEKLYQAKTSGKNKLVY